ncbi:hypothetical protein AOLI_G00263280 [Acnodon oligacanthus]
MSRCSRRRNDVLLSDIIGDAGLVLVEKKEAWLLYDDSFYYLWEAEGNCTEAAKFCGAKGSNIRLAVLTQRNRSWRRLVPITTTVKTSEPFHTEPP